MNGKLQIRGIAKIMLGMIQVEQQREADNEAIRRWQLMEEQQLALKEDKHHEDNYV